MSTTTIRKIGRSADGTVSNDRWRDRVRSVVEGVEEARRKKLGRQLNAGAAPGVEKGMYPALS
jgi:hypothetical protein